MRETTVGLKRNGKPTAEPPAAGLSPYLAVRREWDERYGDLLTRMRNWRLMAFAGAGLAFVAVLGLVAQTVLRRDFEIVVLDDRGNEIASARSGQSGVATEDMKRSQLEDWVGDLRLVTVDPVV